MPDNPFHIVETPRFTVTYVLGLEDDPLTVENTDAIVTAPDGTRWSATLLTHREIGRVMDRWSVSGECAGGSYFQVQDLVIVRDPGVGSMTKALADIFEEYGMDTDVLPRLRD
ncbi:hypothetical protein [Streptomyces virginiae]|uniref:hypothetical protein n=1 Tax=Streptomyces virginiae TaxID=1961 RepID=UPI00225B3EBF|nr:hypothetical protein [Streptomyces virginiae]MCX4958025.1 hypothetical protein [Streptomyces virginiae]MCX5176853.1 hypothetical protein [Streptomyces virginiae]